jgi:hypothetical protein
VLVRYWLPVVLAAAVAAFTPPGAVAQSAARDTDLDRFMAAVLARRDDNWKKLQQYILDERERVQILGPGGARLYGLVRDYRWFVKDGYFIRSPLAANGVPIGDDERRKEEAAWLRREQRREKRQADRAREKAKESGEPAPAEPEPPVEAFGDVLRQQSEPSFVRAAYFLKFRFEAGRYALRSAGAKCFASSTTRPACSTTRPTTGPAPKAAPGAPGGAIVTTTVPTRSASSGR